MIGFVPLNFYARVQTVSVRVCQNNVILCAAIAFQITCTELFTPSCLYSGLQLFIPTYEAAFSVMLCAQSSLPPQLLQFLKRSSSQSRRLQRSVLLCGQRTLAEPYLASWQRCTKQQPSEFLPICPCVQAFIFNC